jgi:hypothetical protein
MKNIRAAVRALLLADSTVNSLVGGVRIHVVRLPQGQKDPSIVFNRINETGDYHMQGDSRLAQTRIQLDAWATRNDSACQLADAAYEVMTGFAGDVVWGSNSPTETVTIMGTFLDQGREDFDQVAELFRMSRDYIVFYRA